MKHIAFFVFMLAAWLLIVAYLLVHGYRTFSAQPIVRGIYITAITVSFISFPLAMTLGDKMPLFLARPLNFIGSTFLILSLYLFIAFLLVDAVRLINHVAHFTSQTAQLRLWVTVGLMCAILVVMIIGNIKFNHPSVVNINIQTNKPPQGKEMKIVGISDLHLSVPIGKKQLAKYVRMINEQKPDMVIIAGDLIDRSLSPVIQQNMHEELLQIKARLGVYAVLGNHEYFGRDEEALRAFYCKSGITLLRDNAALVDSSLYILGRDDYMNKNRKPLPSMVAGLNPTLPIILIDHQPWKLHQAEGNGVDFQFSGHTHDGQFFPVNLIVKRLYELPYGYMKKGNTHYYVTSGLGLWGPQYRIGSKSELVVINFRY